MGPGRKNAVRPSLRKLERENSLAEIKHRSEQQRLQTDMDEVSTEKKAF